MKQQAGPPHHSSSSATIVDTHSPTTPQSWAAASTEHRHLALHSRTRPPQAFLVHMAEKMALGPQIVGLPSPLLLGSSQEKETLKGNGPETETPACSNES